jgi:hypothetical protein
MVSIGLYIRAQARHRLDQRVRSCQGMAFPARPTVCSSAPVERVVRAVHSRVRFVIFMTVSGTNLSRIGRACVR